MKLRGVFRYLLILNLSLFFCVKTLAQEEIDFNRIGVKQGLSQNTIFAILQDHKGFMWFGTHDGLNKFDGYNFTVYKNIKGDSTSISDNIILAICQSETTHNLWLGTNDGGLCCFNYETEKFTSFNPDPKDTLNSLIDNTITNIVEDDKGLLWVSYEVGQIGCFDPNTGKVKNYALNSLNPRESGFGDIYLYFDSRKFLWVCTKKGLYKFDKSTGTFISYARDNSDPNSIPTDLINAIYEDKDYTFWVSSEEGLIKFLPDDNEFTLFQSNEMNPFSISENHVYITIRDEYDRLWVGTRDGLNLFNDSTNQFWAYKNNLANPYSLSSNNISKLYIDNAGVLWVGTFEDGINTFDTHRKAFKHYKHDPLIPNGLPGKTVRSIFQDKYGVLWIGCVNGGLTKIDRQYNKTEHYDIDTEYLNEMKTNTVTSICEDDKGDLWLGTWESGIVKAVFNDNGRNREIGHFNYYNFNQDDPYSISSSSIQFIFRDSVNRLWIGTAEGLDIYDRKEDRFKHFTFDETDQSSLSDISLQKAIIEEKDKTFWVGTWNGLNKITLSPDFDANFEKAGPMINSLANFEHYFHDPLDTNSLSDSRVISICINNDKTLWVGTSGGGLNKMEFLNDGKIKYTNFNEQNGLPNNVVYCVYNDEEGNIWCSTNNGISEITYPANDILHYKEIDGLQGKEFFWGAGWKGKTGEIFFGGSKGFNAFFPSQISENKYKVPIVFTNLRVFNKTIKPDGEILKRDISEAKEIFLNWGDRVFSIEFSALHYSMPENIKYQYMLVGFDKEWISTGYKNRMITYTNLNPGKYIFCVKATNCDGVWNKDYKSLIVNIEPPFWKTLLFRIAFAIFIISLIYIIFLLRLRNIKEQKRKLEIQVKERTILIENQKDEITVQNEELINQNTNQVRLISILSHDLRSPLATIFSMLDFIVDNWDEHDDNTKNDLISSLKNDTKTTLNLVDNTLDFVRLNQNRLEPHVSTKILGTTVKNALNAYSEQARAKDISLIFSCNFKVEFETDHEMLQHILMNFISNAIKFTPNSKEIKLQVEKLEYELKICVIDQGIGIPKDKLENLFGSGEGYNRAGTQGEKSHGIGLQLVKQYANLIHARIHVESRENEGSKFCLILPLHWES